MGQWIQWDNKVTPIKTKLTLTMSNFQLNSTVSKNSKIDCSYLLMTSLGESKHTFKIISDNSS